MALLDMFSGGAFSNARSSLWDHALYLRVYRDAARRYRCAFYPEAAAGRGERAPQDRPVDTLSTVVLLLVQGSAYLVNLNMQLRQAGGSLPEGLWFDIYAIVVMAAGSMFVLWLGERITDKGLGNGVSLIIMIGIIARLPGAVLAEWGTRASGGAGGLVWFLFEIVFLLAVMAGAILLVQGTRLCRTVR